MAVPAGGAVVQVRASHSEWLYIAITRPATCEVLSANVLSFLKFLSSPSSPSVFLHIAFLFSLLLPLQDIQVELEDQKKINLFARKNANLTDNKEQIEEKEVNVYNIILQN